ncbi:MAG TPA: hypothetical protein VND93_21540, partial [Myxococcales bacterium]|nr:hypothetical protein [Myxococcales bacterium]
TGGPVDLGGMDLLLVNGDDTSTIAHREYTRFRLVGTVSDAGVATNVLPAGGYMVAGRGDGGTLTLLVPVPDDALRLAWNTANTVQNGPADGVALLHYATGTVVDSVVYAGAPTTGTTTFTFATGVGDRTVNVAETRAADAGDIGNDAGAIARQPNGVDTNNNEADWRFVPTYTPGAANP